MDRQFKLIFDPEKIEEYAARYSFSEDTQPLQAGKQIREGKYTRENLEVIFEWKTGGRGRSRLLENSDEEIADALWLATIAVTDRAAVAVLVGLNGVEVSVASAILTAMYPERFTIIDFRALEALGVDKWPGTVNYYLEYLDACRALSRDNSVTLRTLDRSLWQWSKERGELRQYVTEISSKQKVPPFG
jgi:hypothetical protein